MIEYALHVTSHHIAKALREARKEWHHPLASSGHPHTHVTTGQDETRRDYLEKMKSRVATGSAWRQSNSLHSLSSCPYPRDRQATFTVR